MMVENCTLSAVFLLVAHVYLVLLWNKCSVIPGTVNASVCPKPVTVDV